MRFLQKPAPAWNNGGTLAGWTTSGTVSTDSTNGKPAPCISISGNLSYAYTNIGLAPGMKLEFDVMVLPGTNTLCDILFLCNSSGAGQVLRLDCRPSSPSGIASSTTWVVFGSVTGTYQNLAASVWHHVAIVINSSTSATCYINDMNIGTFTIVNNGGYIGLNNDYGGGCKFDNFRVSITNQTPPPFMYLTNTVYPENQWVTYRTTINYSDGEYPVQMVCSGDARLFVNGQLAISSVGKSSFVALRPRQVDISPYLVNGTNVLRIEHYQRGRDRLQFSKKNDLPYAGMYFYDMATGNANSGAGWKARISPEYANTDFWMFGDTPSISTPAQVHIGDCGGQNNHCIIINTLSIASNIDSTSYTYDGTWANAVVVKFSLFLGQIKNSFQVGYHLNAHTPASSIVGSSTDPGDSAYSSTYGLCPMAPRIKNATLTPNGVNATASYNASTNTVSLQSVTDDAYATLNFGKFVYGTLKLNITVPSGGTGVLDVAFSEHEPDVNGYSDPTLLLAPFGADRINLSPGTFTIRLGFGGYAARGGRTLHLVARNTGGVTISIIPTVEQSSYIQNTGYVPTINDTTMQNYFNLARNNISAHLHDTIHDHSIRDGGQWSMDGYAIFRGLGWLYGNNPYRKILLDQMRDAYGFGIQLVGATSPVTYTDKPTGGGSLFSQTPPICGGVCFDWGLSFIWSLYDEYWWTGDKEILQKHYPVMQNFINNIPGSSYISAIPFSANAYGDWMNPDNLNMLLQNTWLIKTLQQGAYIADVLGDTIQAQTWTTRAQSIISSVQSWRQAQVGAIPAYPMYPGGISTFHEAGIMESVAVGAIDSSDVSPLVSYITSIAGNSDAVPSGGISWSNWLMLQSWPLAVKKNNGNPLAWMKATLQGYNLYKVLPELRMLGPLPYGSMGGNTCSHAWTGSGIAGFIEGGLGVSLANPGGSIAFSPCLGLPDLSFVLQSPQGQFEVQKSGTQWTITAPTNGTMQVVLGGNNQTLQAGQTAVLTET